MKIADYITNMKPPIFLGGGSLVSVSEADPPECINLWLLWFAYAIDDKGFQLLAILNMILLSFIFHFYLFLFATSPVYVAILYIF